MRPVHRSALGTLRFRLLLVGALAWSAASADRAALAATTITTAPTEITKPGKYLLKKSLTCAGDGIVIRASGVKLLLGGNTLTGPGNGTSVGIRVAGTPTAPLKNIQIKDGIVEGFGVGVVLEGATGCRIKDLVSQDNVSGALPGDGLQLINSSKNRVNDCTLTRNQAFGARLIDADDNRFRCNTVTANVGPLRQGGVLLAEGSTGNRIVGCDISGNGEVGISLSDLTSGENVIQGCTIQGNDVLPDSSQAGILVVSSGNKVRANTVNLNRVGISVSFNARSNTVHSNTALDNRLRDLQDFNLPQSVNTWRSNTFAVDNETGGGFGPKAGVIR